MSKLGGRDETIKQLQDRKYAAKALAHQKRMHIKAIKDKYYQDRRAFAIQQKEENEKRDRERLQRQLAYQKEQEAA